MMMKMNSSLLENKQLLYSFSVVSCVVFAFGAFKIISNKIRKPTASHSQQQIELQQTQINKQLNKLNELQSILSKKAQQLQIKYMKNAPHILTADSIKEIFAFTSYIIDKEELQNIYMNNRKARRTILEVVRSKLGEGTCGELQTYYRFICTFQEEIQYLIEKTQKDFVVFLNIDYSVITESIEFHMCQSQTGLADWIKTWSYQIKEQLKQKLPLFQSAVQPQIIFDIVKFQIESLTTEGQKIKKSIFDLHLQTEDQQQAIPTFLQCLLEDLIYQKYKYEIQQINLSPEDMTRQFQEDLHMLSELQNNILKKAPFEEFDKSERYDSSENDL